MLPTYAERHGSTNPDLRGWFLTLARTVAVDFDGVIHPYTNGWTGPIPDDEEPTDGAREFLEWLCDEGYRVVVFSTRAESIEGNGGICAWLEEHDLNNLVDEVTHTKPPAFAYVDDRAVAYLGDWRPVREAVLRLSKARSHGAATSEPSDPTDHLDTPEYWKELYLLAVKEGQEQIRRRDWLAAELAAMCGGTAQMWKDRAEADWPHPTKAADPAEVSDARS